MAELLVVSAVLAILGAIMFPVFRAAIDAAKRTHCVSNFRQIGHALAIYQSDYDDRVPPVNYTNVQLLNPHLDRTWVQTLLPYVKNLGLFTCPADTGRNLAAMPAPDPTVGDPWGQYYRQTLRSNLGYNFLYFSPLVQLTSGEWRSFPIQAARVANPAGTLVFLDSVWDRTGSGFPLGGGSWVVVPPCRYVRRGGQIRDTFEFVAGAAHYFGFEPVGWQPESSQSWLVYGGAWPWHRGKFNVAFFDGRAKTVNLGDLTFGCDFQPGWQGLIDDLAQYPWDLDE